MKKTSEKKKEKRERASINKANTMYTDAHTEIYTLETEACGRAFAGMKPNPKERLNKTRLKK